MTTFVTGFPGFLGTALVDRLVATAPREADLTCLVQAAYRDLAERRAAAIEADHGADDAIALVEGDVTQPDLDLDEAYERLQAAVVEVFHLAAAYDLGVDADLARRVNVRGTTHLLDFAAGASALERFHHVSTCYVSGRYDGRFGPADLLVGQRFNNRYEATKFQAEVAVRRAMAGGLPATIYRPGIVVGDSDTGATRKYDGPYQLVRFLLAQPRVAVVPVVGDPASTELNVVPRDYVVEAILVLGDRSDSLGETYQLANPAPPTVASAIDALAAAAGRRVFTPRVPRRALATALSGLPGLEERTGIDAELVPYFDLPTRYDAAKSTAALAGTGVDCPRFASYADRLVDHVREHPEADGGPLL